eukprot:scaffold2093_cov141-Alexandrium_tamarense.AAC.1
MNSKASSSWLLQLMLLTTSHASIVKDLVVASKQNNLRGLQLNKFTNVWGISTSALRYYAGGSAYDIMSSYGISHSELFESVWYVVDAVNASFNIEYPRNHSRQLAQLNLMSAPASLMEYSFGF